MTRFLAEVVDNLEDVLRSHGFVRCDIPACNCGSWHPRYGLYERWQEIKDALEDADVLNNETGNLPLRAVKLLIEQRDALRQHLHDEHQRHVVTMDERDSMTPRQLQSLRNLGNECEVAADEIERLRAELAALQDGPMVARSDGSSCTLRQWAVEMKQERDLAREGWHTANGTAELAMKHRKSAEAELKAARALLLEAQEWLDDYTPKEFRDRIDAALDGKDAT